MDIKGVLSFLGQVEAHNDREWFADHRAEYLSAKACFDELVQEIITGVAAFDPSVGYLTPKDCTYRIYRDTRFSSDKSPYKTHMGAYINAKGKKSFHSGYYVHLQNGECMLAGGSYCLPTPLLNQIRKEIYYNLDEFLPIVKDRQFSKLFPEIGGERLKTMPHGFPKDFPYPEYLKCKDYTVWHHVDDDFFTQAEVVADTCEVFRIMKPFNDFINSVVDDYE